jgi:RecA-family ATPase
MANDTSGSAYRGSLANLLQKAGGFLVQDFGHLLWVWPHAIQGGTLEEKITKRQISRDWVSLRPVCFIEFPPAPSSLGTLELEWITPFDPTLIPKRAWVLGRFLARGYLTGLVAPPGAGKTTPELMMAVAIASGKGDIIGLDVPQRTRVFVWNQEDEIDELKRRLAAILKAFDLSFDDIAIDGRPGILLGSGVSKAIMLAQRKKSGPIGETEIVSDLIKAFLQDGIGVAMFDPLVELHQADENNNVEMGAVGRVFRRIAVEAHAAVLIVHHTRKLPNSDSTGHIGNMESGRGGGSLFGVARMGATLYTIDDKTAKAYGVPETERHKYVRLDGGKNNMALTGGEPAFYMREV